MRPQFVHLVRLAGLASLLLTACAPSGNAGRANQTASRILTAVATQANATRVVTSAPAAAIASPPPTAPTATPRPPLVFARCIVRAELPMRVEPGESSREAAPLKPSEIVTAYGRTEDSQWILTWNREITYGWIPSTALGCTAPFEDLRPTESDILLTPQPTVAPPTFPGSVAGVAAVTPPPTELPATSPATSSPSVTETPPPTTATTTPEPAAAGPAANETPIPVDQTTPVATVATATAAITATGTPTMPAATATVVEAKSLEPLVCVVAITRALNLRAGPDRTTRLLGQLRPGAKFSATARNADATWLYGATERGDFGWVIASALRCDGDANSLPVVNGG